MQFADRFLSSALSHSVMRKIAVFCCLTALGFANAVLSAPLAPRADADPSIRPAEYAVRWSLADGGPQNAEEVAAALQLKGGKHKQYEVRYFSVRQPTSGPGGRAIVRERQTKHETETMYKLRSDQAFGAGDPLAGWVCPFPADIRARSKSDVDVGWLAEGKSRRSYSLSCEADVGPDALPAELQAKPLDCSSRVRRSEIEDIKIEAWRLPGGEKILEVSWNGKDTAADLEQFSERIVRPLLARGIHPREESKTELGSGC